MNALPVSQYLCQALSPLPFYERSVGFASVQSLWAFNFGHPCPSLVKGEVLSPTKIRATTGGIVPPSLDLHQPFQNRTIPRLALNLPPLSKGGGLTARHKLLLCCFLLAIHPPFLFTKPFCRQDGGIASRCTEYCHSHNLLKSTTAFPHTNPSKTALSLAPHHYTRHMNALPVLHTHYPTRFS